MVVKCFGRHLAGPSGGVGQRQGRPPTRGLGEAMGAVIELRRYVSLVSWKTHEARGQFQFDEVVGRPPDRRYTVPYDDSGWSHHAEWYSGTRTEGDKIEERIRQHVGARVRVYDLSTEGND